jgi:hypothetical protein
LLKIWWYLNSGIIFDNSKLINFDFLK